MNDRFKMDNTHPGSFEYAWLTATQEVRQRFMELYERLGELDSEKEMRFMLWMAGQDEDTRRAFLAIVGRGLRTKGGG